MGLVRERRGRVGGAPFPGGGGGARGCRQPLLRHPAGRLAGDRQRAPVPHPGRGSGLDAGGRRIGDRAGPTGGKRGRTGGERLQGWLHRDGAGAGPVTVAAADPGPWAVRAGILRAGGWERQPDPPGWRRPLL
ncbi:protein of unknown function [Candidatus Hydrogenisulfobacillus filiaventi]|uniref:Uncharacterized protein n=1 Tax=Candidatus Hydrogenisulfobacillus filiaventi TaxID=2707344 RepID=A0A6F8ZHX4_9FIRM|nr:protein of unknown function [Candidatus Hydrogenisulfobacillus filiaventi]